MDQASTPASGRVDFELMKAPIEEIAPRPARKRWPECAKSVLAAAMLAAAGKAAYLDPIEALRYE